MLLSSYKSKAVFAALHILISFQAWGADFNIRETLKEPSAYFDPEAVKLLDALEKENLPRAKLLMQRGIDLDSKGPATTNPNVQQITLLSYALGKNEPKMASFLLDMGANPLFKPSMLNSNTFLFLIVRRNTEMLGFLYQKWPVAKLSNQEQLNQAFTALDIECMECLQVMFNNGISTGIKDENGNNLFMQAMKNEQWDMAGWLLSKGKVNMTDQSNSGVNPPNAVQFNLFRYKDNSVIYDKISRMKDFMEKNHNIRFPVKTSIQLRSEKFKENKNFN